MSDNDEDVAPSAEAEAPKGVGEQLRTAREGMGLSIEQIAAQTRVSRRQLEKIEQGKFDEIPGRIYAIGFARNYAKAVGLNSDDVAALVRAELGDEGEAQDFGPDFAPGDPARVPSGRLVWFSVFAVAILLVGIYFAAKVMMDPAASLSSLTEQERAEQAAAEAERQAEVASASEPVDAAGAVVLTAEGPVWLRISDGAGVRLMEGELAEGQSFTLPAQAEGPKLMTGRPDLLQIAIGGRAVPKISEELRTVSNVPIDAASLLARPIPTSAPASSSTTSAPQRAISAEAVD